MFSLRSLLDMSQGIVAGILPAPDLVFNGAQTDSRKVRPGQLFVAYRGDSLDGHDYAPQAVNNGASALLVERPLALSVPQVVVPDPRASLATVAGDLLQQSGIQHTVGITGSAGKTTTRAVVAGVFEAAAPGAVLASVGSFNTDTGVSMSILDGLRPGLRLAVFELGMQTFGEIEALCKIVRPHAGIVTMVGGAHLEFMKTLENVTFAKSELVRALPTSGIALLNSDDPRVMTMANMTAAKVTTFGLSSDADCFADDIQTLPEGLQRFQWHCGQHHGRTTTRLLGRHNLRNVLAAIGVSTWVGIPSDVIDMAIPDIQPPPGRLQLLPGINGATVLDDSYNASRGAVLAALETLRQYPARRRIALLGDMFELGDASREEHSAVGTAAADVVDLLGVLGHDARWIADGAVAHGVSATRITHFPCNTASGADKERARGEASRWLQALLRDGDVVLIKASHGMGLEHVVDQVKGHK